MTEERQRVILYGDSLILEGLHASLAPRPGFEILVLDQPLVGGSAKLRSLCPAALVFDLRAVEPDFPLALLQQPGLRLIGIDPETHQALVWCGRQVAAVDAEDLVQLLLETRNGSTTTIEEVRHHEGQEQFSRRSPRRPGGSARPCQRGQRPNAGGG